ncbi:MAG: GtrA family protein [Oscillospiraceae bacterium]|nr:GtrA family protein [Oscillospiraceae bacterium]
MKEQKRGTEKLKELILKIWRKFRSFILYAIFGCLNTLIDFLVFTGAYELLRLSPEFSHVLGYIAGFISGFLLNRNITFRKENSSNVFLQILKFILVNLVSLGSSTLFLHLLTGAGVNEYIAKVLVQVVVTLINFFGYRFFVFRKDNKKPELQSEPDVPEAARKTDMTEGENDK